MKKTGHQSSRRDFIKWAALFPLTFGIRTNTVQACPLCWVFRAVIGWGGRGALMESLTANAVRTAVTVGTERAILRSTFSQAAKTRLISAMRLVDGVSETYDLLNNLEAFADKNPELVSLHNKYENEIEAWWTINQSDNPLTIELSNMSEITLETQLILTVRDKESHQTEIKPWVIPIRSEPHSRFNPTLYVSGLKNQGVKEVVATINHPDFNSAIKTVFVI